MSKIRVVLAGCGGISATWMTGVKDLPDVEMVGFVDIKREAASARAQQFGWTDAAIGTDLNAVLRDTRPDVVFDCAVPEAHLAITLEALEQGCHVLGEKPLADSMENARTMVAAAQGAGRLFAVMQNRRYDARIRRLKAYLVSGAVGPLTTLHCDFFIGAHFGGFRDQMAHVLLLDMAIHTFDAARFITGADPVAVYCKEWNPAGSWYDQDASAVAVFQMSNGLVYTYRGSWCSEGLHTTWESDWRVIGQHGSVCWDGADGFQAEAVTKAGGFMSDKANVEVPAHDAGGKDGGHAGCIRDFVRCVQTGDSPETIASDNVKSLAMVFGAIESARTGREVAV